MTILAIDLGTTTVKVSLFADNMAVIDSAHERVNTVTGAGGLATQDASDWLEIIGRNCAGIRASYPQEMLDVAGIAVTGHMMGCLPVDRAGRPLADHMLHSDTRARSQYDRIEALIGSDNFYYLTGNILSAASVLAKILWFRDNHPDLYNKTACFLNAKDFISGFLTSCFNKTDYSDASHAGLIDISTRKYPQELFNELDLDINKMPELHAGTDQIGSLSESAAKFLGINSGIPVMAGSGDGACSAIGSAAGSLGDIYCCMGTTAWIAAVNDKPIFDKHRRSFNIITADGSAVSTYGTTQNCGRSTDFAQRFFAIPNMRDFDELAASAPAGSDNLIFLPYLDGERSPIYDPDTQGVFFGLNKKHGREHGLRSILEGVAFALRHIAEVHRENGIAINRVSLIGGGGRSEIWRQILASTIPAEIIRVDVPSEDATTLGAAIIAGTGAGLFGSIQQGLKYIKEIEATAPEAKWVPVYDRLFEIYSGLYPALRSSYKALAADK